MIGYGTEKVLMKHAEAVGRVDGSIERMKQTIVRQLRSQGGSCAAHRIKTFMKGSGNPYTYRLALDSLVKDQAITEEGGSVRLHPEKVSRYEL